MGKRISFASSLIVGTLLIGMLLVALALAVTVQAQEKAEKVEKEEAAHEFIGVKKCGMCHKAEAKGNQLGQWEASKHAKAFETLASEEALAIAKEKGLKAAPQESDACLKCHVTGHGQPAELFAKTFDKTQGVQCESCHGAGGDYKSMKLMKVRDDAVAAGLVIPTEETCVQCHNEESPTFKKFVFKEAFETIAHPNPKKAKSE